MLALLADWIQESAAQHVIMTLAVFSTLLVSVEVYA